MRIIMLVEGGSGDDMWRDVTDSESHRPAERDIEITGVESMGVEGNPKSDGGFYTWGIIKVETNTSHYGIGETFRGEESMDVAERMESLVVGQNPLDPERIYEHLAGKYTGSGTVGQSAITAIETACWDIKGKALDVPVYELLGGKFRDEVRVYSDTQASARSEGASEEFTPDAFARAARDVVDQGFESIKFDLDVMTPGYPNDDTVARRMDDREIEHKVELVRAVRDEIGYEVDLGMDLHWKYSVETAVRLGRALEEFGLSFLEDPVHPEKLDAQARVRDQVDIPILTGENVTTVNRFFELLKHDTLDLAAPDVTECGGLSVFKNIAAVCDVYGVPMAPHNLASPVGTVAGVHAAASIPNFYSLEFRGGDAPWWDDVVVRTGEVGPIFADGRIDLPEGPGLGIEVNPDLVTERLTAESEYIF